MNEFDTVGGYACPIDPAEAELCEGCLYVNSLP